LAYQGLVTVVVFKYQELGNTSLAWPESINVQVVDVHKQIKTTQQPLLLNKILPCSIPLFKEYFTVLVIFFCISGHCQLNQEPLNSYNINCYDTNDGLPQNSITDVAINSDGQLLIATYSGVVIFDGNRFSNIIPDTNRPFPNAEAFKLGVDKLGAIWIGTTSSGLYRVMGNNTQHWDINNGLQSHIIHKIKTIDEGMLINSDGRILLFRYGKEHQIEHIAIEDSLYLSAFADIEQQLLPSNNTLKPALETPEYLAKNGQVFKVSHENTELLISEFIKDTTVSISKLMLGSDNTLWIATATKGLFRYNANGLEYFNHLPNNRLSSIVEDEDGTIWVGTSGGLCMLKLGAVRNISELHGLYNQSIFSVAADSIGRVYAIPYGKTKLLSYIQDKKIYNKFFMNEGTDGTIIRAIVNDKTGQTWIATENKIGKLIDDGSDFSIETHIELNSRTRSLLIDDSQIWYQQGSYLIKHGNPQKTKFLIGKDNVDIRSIRRP
jgi:ligand-binding sensor domain-containing protein